MTQSDTDFLAECEAGEARLKKWGDTIVDMPTEYYSRLIALAKASAEKDKRIAELERELSFVQMNFAQLVQVKMRGEI